RPPKWWFYLAKVVVLRGQTNICAADGTVSKRLAAGRKMTAFISCINPWLVMRLLPMKEPDRSWRSIKGQWRKDAESVGEDFSTFSTGIFSAYDALTKDGDSPNLYCLSDGER